MGGWWVRNDSISSARVSSEKLEQPWATREKKAKNGGVEGKGKGGRFLQHASEGCDLKFPFSAGSLAITCSLVRNGRQSPGG